MADSLNIPPTESSPRIEFDATRGLLLFEGESYPEDVTEFFGPIIDWIDSEVGPGMALTVILRLWYLNTGSTKALLIILRQLQEKADSGTTIAIEWHHLRDLELMREAGEELLHDCRLEYRIVAVDTV